MDIKFAEIFRNIKYERQRRALEHDALSDDEKRIAAGRRNFIADNVSLFIISQIAAGSYLAGLLKLVGVPDELNGLILAVPVLAGLFQIIGAIISQHLNKQKILVITGIAINRTCMAAIFLYPLLFGPGIFASAMIVITYVTGHFAGTISGPSGANWLVSMVPDKIRARFFSLRERITMFGVAAAMVTVSLILDKYKQLGNAVYGFAIIGVILLVIAVINIVFMVRTHEPPSALARSGFTLSSLSEPIKDKDFRRVIVVLIMWQVSANIAIPFMGLYFINNIGLSYTVIGLVTFFVTIQKALIANLWGKFADKTSWELTLEAGIMIFAISQLVFVFMSVGNKVWLYPINMILANVSWAVLNMAFFNFQFRHLNPAKSTLYLGVCNAISGLAGFLAALAGSQIMNLVSNFKDSDSGYRAVILLSAVIGVGLSLYIRFAFAKERNRQQIH